MGRNRCYPRDDVTIGEWLYLLRRYSSVEARERRERLAAAIKRLASVGKDHRRVHDALMLGIATWDDHLREAYAHKYVRRHNEMVIRAQRDVDRAIVSLRKLFKPDPIEMDAVLDIRDALEPIRAPGRRAQRGRPWEHVKEARSALRQIAVADEDRKELLSALGFTE
jgi:hypothetical protein